MVNVEDINKLQEKEVQKKINLKVLEIQRSHETFVHELELYIPRLFYQKWRVQKFLIKHNERIRKIMLSKQVEFENLIK